MPLDMNLHYAVVSTVMLMCTVIIAITTLLFIEDFLDAKSYTLFFVLISSLIQTIILDMNLCVPTNGCWLPVQCQ